MAASGYCDEPLYTLRDFVACHPLPKNVRVVDGVYGDKDFETLSAEQLITLHAIKRADKVAAVLKAEDGETVSRFSIPLNYKRKFEILPITGQERYDNIPDLLCNLPPFVRVLHDIPWLNLRAGDILRPLEQVTSNRTEFLLFEFHDQRRGSVQIPVSYGITLEALADADCYFLMEVVEKFTLPVRVRLVADQSVDPVEEVQVAGALILEEQVQEETVIASSDCDTVVVVLNMSLDLDITICPEPDPVPGDKTYLRFCNFMQDGERLEKFDDWMSQRVRRKEPIVEVMDYEEIGPALPMRTSRDHNDHVAVTCAAEIGGGSHAEPPARPPKPPHFSPPKVESKQWVRQDPDGQEEEKDHWQEEEDTEEDEYLTWSACAELRRGSTPLPPERTLSLPNYEVGDAVVGVSSMRAKSLSDEDYLQPCGGTTGFPSSTDLESPSGGTEDDVSPEDDDDVHEYIEIEEQLPKLKKRAPLKKFFGEVKRTFVKLSTSMPRSNPVQPVAAADATASLDVNPFRRYGTSHVAGENRNTDDRSGSSDADPNFSGYRHPSGAPVGPVGGGGGSGEDDSTDGCGVVVVGGGGGDSVCVIPPDASSYKPTKELSVEEVAQWLGTLNMQQHIPTFSKNLIDGELLIDMTTTELHDLGVTRPMDVKKIKKFIEGWRPNIGSQ